MSRTMATPTHGTEIDYLDQYKEGNQTFSLLFTRWMDTNGWSHPNIVALAQCALNGVSWLHSSQVSAFRHNKLASPGPRQFMAIERLNFYVHRYLTKKTLIPNTTSSNLYTKPFAITEGGKPPELGWWIEVFCGARVPADIDLRQHFFTDETAKEISSRWGALIRRLLMEKQIDLVLHLDRIIREQYPAKDVGRVQTLVDVIQNRDAWSADQLANELPAISELTARLGGPATENALLEQLNGKSA